MSGAVRKDEILLADKEIFFHGQLVALVVGDSLEACRLAADAVKVEYEPSAPVLDHPRGARGGKFSQPRRIASAGATPTRSFPGAA